MNATDTKTVRAQNVKIGDVIVLSGRENIRVSRTTKHAARFSERFDFVGVGVDSKWSERVSFSHTDSVTILTNA